MGCESRLECFALYLNYIQIGVAVWYFIRDMKFCKIPYVVFNSFLNYGFSECKVMDREVLVLKAGRAGVSENIDDDYNEDLFLVQTISVGRQSILFNHPKYKGMEKPTFLRWIKRILCINTVESPKLIAENGKSYGERLLLDSNSLSQFKFWLAHSETRYTIKTADYLMRGAFLVQNLNHDACIEHIKAGNHIVIENIKCLVDQSGDDELNKNFLKFIQIVPPFLQARKLSVLSAFVFLFYVFFDFFNKAINKVWQKCKFWCIQFVKLLLGYFPLGFRMEAIGILSSASKKFVYCDKSVQRLNKIRSKKLLFAIGNCYLPLKCKIERINLAEPWVFELDFQTKESETLYFFINGCQVKVCLVRVNHLSYTIYTEDRFGETFTKEGNSKHTVLLFLNSLKQCEKFEQYPIVECRSRFVHVKSPMDILRDRGSLEFVCCEIDLEEKFTVS